MATNYHNVRFVAQFCCYFLFDYINLRIVLISYRFHACHERHTCCSSGNGFTRYSPPYLLPCWLEWGSKNVSCSKKDGMRKRTSNCPERRAPSMHADHRPAFYPDQIRRAPTKGAMP
jgi:hypothetical protein